MQTPINLWLWRYRSTRSVYQGWHIKADEVACLTLIARLSDPDLEKASFSLQTVPDNMPLILAPANVMFDSFERLRLRVDREQSGEMRFELEAGYLDLYLNTAGIATVLEGITTMLNGEWDFCMGDISYWGLVSVTGDKKPRGRVW